ncbi:MAG: hypothetical protein ACKVJX_10175 [Verrucomicrobiia bacterium]|jgi:uncharacterized membrane protein
MTHWSFGASMPLMLLAALIWLAAVWLARVNWRRRGRTRLVALLEGLRVVIVTLLVFTLLRPEIVKVIERTEDPEIVILTDASGSMATKDLIVSNSVVSRADWLGAQREREFWKSLESSAKVRIEEFAAPESGAPAEGTDIDRALENVLQRDRHLKAVLLLTDGDWNSGKSPVSAATRFRERNAPVFSIAVGRETPLPDLSLERVKAPVYGLVGEQISIPFRIKSHLPEIVETTVTIRRDDQQEAKRDIVIPSMSELQEAIVWSPRAVGEYTLTVDLPVQEGESQTDNNSQTFRIAIRSETLKVLVVESQPRWEFRFLRNALERDPGVEMHAVLFHPSLPPGGGRGYLPAFPGSKELLSGYDVIFLGDVGVGSGELKEGDAQLIKGLVEQQASGLVFLPGVRGRQHTFTNTPLADLMPVTLDPQRPEGVGLRNEASLALSSRGRDHLLTRFDVDATRNAGIWKRLPGFYWCAAVEKSRPGSTVLAVHSAMRNRWGRLPLLVSKPYGNGKTLFMGTDSAWRWRRGVEDKYHYQFWSQVVRWMAHQRHLSERQGIRLSFSPESPQVGETVFLQATVMSQGGLPIDRGPVIGKITSESGATERVEFSLLEGGWGVFQSSFVPERGEIYNVVVEAPKHDRELETKIDVASPTIERTGQPVNSKILDEIAAITLGESGAIEDLDGILERIALLPEPRPLEKRIRLWASPWWGGLILLLLGVYWAGRKMAGMI